MTKETQAVHTVTTSAIKKPLMLRIIGPLEPSLAEAVVHLRSGYVFVTGNPLEYFPHTGHCCINLQIGQPEPYAVAAAEKATAEALEMEAQQYKKDVDAAAQLLFKDHQRQELEKAVAAELAEHELKVQEIQAAAAQAIAKLNK